MTPAERKAKLVTEQQVIASIKLPKLTRNENVCGKTILLLHHFGILTLAIREFEQVVDAIYGFYLDSTLGFVLITGKQHH
jgi:hypothetical protein